VEVVPRKCTTAKWIHQVHDDPNPKDNDNTYPFGLCDSLEFMYAKPRILPCLGARVECCSCRDVTMFSSNCVSTLPTTVHRSHRSKSAWDLQSLQGSVATPSGISTASHLTLISSAAFNVLLTLLSLGKFSFSSQTCLK
jgi:hypothetical protein